MSSPIFVGAAARPSGDPRSRWRVALSVGGGAVLGAAPHVLHHVGPIAGAAVLAGATGTILFGLLGLVAALPLLARLRRRTGSWRIPIGLLGVFAAMFAISTAFVGPALSGEDDPSTDATPAASPSEHEEHHN